MLRRLRVLTCLTVFAFCEIAGYLAGARPTIVMTRGLVAMAAVWLSFRLAAALLTWVTWTETASDEETALAGGKDAESPR